ncbi:sodium:solute symporter family protein [Geosporobacter ferrireducens]|uniref:Symporter n=1 Tax=Geosporobacter ferrireducens TaxID=1424294 RepID=A0A1D8GIU6_9FIRM|nr:sodium:solute symporter family protein [Geosporobacter ferrireducens]AOT70831.1 symporter [Geosporobacter ferrireducens]MTI53534.1 sodium:solute symporter family protein [Geosporobacter ferrireducens]
MNIPLLIVICYIIALFAISAFARKLAAKGSEDFILAGRKLTTPLVAVTITGLAIGGASTIGVSEQAYNVGLAAGWYNVAWAAGAIVMGLVAAARYRSLNISTVPELFEKFYDTKGRVICVIGQIIIQLVITSLQYVAGGAILAALLPEIFTFKSGMLVSAIVFISITFIGGMWSAGLSNLLNVALIYLGTTIAAIMSIVGQGGLNTIRLELPAEVPYLHPINGLGWIVIAGWFAVMITQVLSLQGTVQISCGAKDEKSARRGFIIGGMLMIPIGFLSALMGIAAKVAFPDISATLALPKIIMSLNPVIAGLTLAALWAADVSTACNLLLGSATLFSQDIYKRFIRPDSTEKHFMLITKASICVLGLLTLFMAFTVVGILKTLLIGLSLTTAFTVVFLFTIFTPGLCRKNSAFYTTLAGMLVLILWQFVPAIRILPHVIYLEWLVCVSVFLLMPLLDKRPIHNIGMLNPGDSIS